MSVFELLNSLVVEILSLIQLGLQFFDQLVSAVNLGLKWCSKVLLASSVRVVLGLKSSQGVSELLQLLETD